MDENIASFHAVNKMPMCVEGRGVCFLLPVRFKTELPTSAAAAKSVYRAKFTITQSLNVNEQAGLKSGPAGL